MEPLLVNNDIHNAIRQVVLQAVRSKHELTAIIAALEAELKDLRHSAPLVQAVRDAQRSPV